MASNTEYGLYFDLGEEIDMLRDSVRRFAEAEIAPFRTGRSVLKPSGALDKTP
jgi:hypothetical protein